MKRFSLILPFIIPFTSVFGGNASIQNFADSTFEARQFDVIELTDEEIVYDAYQVKTEVAERTLIGEARMVFTEDEILLQFELPDYMVSTEFDFIIPDREIQILMRSICKRYGNEYFENTKVKFFGAGSAISFKCGNKEYLLIEK